MVKVRVSGFSISVDGYGAGPEQSASNALGKSGMELHQWLFGTRTFRAMTGERGGSEGVDDKYAARGLTGFGAVIMGRNMFGPIRGEWLGGSWKGWWGENPPFHAPTIVLTHYPRDPIVMDGGTVFHFATGGIQDALKQAKTMAGDRDIRIGGGVATIRQFLQAGMIDELHFAVTPVVFGKGEAMFTNIDLAALGFRVIESALGEQAMHVVLTK
jgi:dihydrofolate reductase